MYNYISTCKLRGNFMKSCTVCNEIKDLDQFDKRKKANGDAVPTGRCKACRNMYMREYLSKKSGKTGLNREEWLNKVRKPKLSSEEKQLQAKAKWDAWYESSERQRHTEQMRLEAEQERKALELHGVKTCSNCKKEQPLSEFHLRKRTRKDGTSYTVYKRNCRTCRNNRAKSYRKENPDIIKAYRKTPRRKAANRERTRLREIRKSHPAVPNWLTKEHRKEIRDIYIHAADCRIVTGEAYHIDHIIPLKGGSVCGLHVPWNLQVLPSDVNMSKSNKWDWGDMDP